MNGAILLDFIVCTSRATCIMRLERLFLHDQNATVKEIF